MRTELLVLALATTGCGLTSARGDLDRIAAASYPLDGALLDAPTLDGPPGLEDEDALEAFLREPLTEERAVRLALLQNRALRAELREVGVTRGALIDASLLPNPVAEIDLRRPDDPAQPLQADFLLEMDLTSTLLVPLRTSAASRDLDAARHRAAASVVRTVYQTRVAFVRARAAEQRLALANQSLDALAAARDAAAMLGESGNVPALDVVTRIAAYEEARLEVASLELARAQAREALVRTLGLSGAAIDVTLDPGPGEVPDEPLDGDVEARAIEASLELAELRARAEAAGLRVDLATLEGWLPDVSVDVHAEGDGPGWEVGGGATFTLPIFDRGEGRTAAASAALEGLIERIEGAAIGIRSAARAAAAQRETARLRAVHLEGVVLPAWAAVVEETRLQYDAMQLSLFELLAALRASLAARLALVAAREELFVADAALDALLHGVRVDAPPPPTGALEAAPTSGGH